MSVPVNHLCAFQPRGGVNTYVCTGRERESERVNGWMGRGGVGGCEKEVGVRRWRPKCNPCLTSSRSCSPPHSRPTHPPTHPPRPPHTTHAHRRRRRPRRYGYTHKQQQSEREPPCSSSSSSPTLRSFDQSTHPPTHPPTGKWPVPLTTANGTTSVQTIPQKRKKRREARPASPTLMNPCR